MACRTWADLTSCRTGDKYKPIVLDRYYSKRAFYPISSYSRSNTNMSNKPDNTTLVRNLVLVPVLLMVEVVLAKTAATGRVVTMLV